jgi:hypothetical protein
MFQMEIRAGYPGKESDYSASLKQPALLARDALAHTAASQRLVV